MLTLLQAPVARRGPRPRSPAPRRPPPGGGEGLDHSLRQARIPARLHHPAIPGPRGRDGRRPAQPTWSPGSSRAGRSPRSVATARYHPATPPGRSPRWPTPCTTPTSRASSTATSGPAPSWSTARPHRTDFGLAVLCSRGAFLTEESPDPAGNPAYVSPGEAPGLGEPDRRPQRRLRPGGPVLHELLTGWLPFRPSRCPEAVRHKLEQDPPLPRPARSAGRPGPGGDLPEGGHGQGPGPPASDCRRAGRGLAAVPGRSADDRRAPSV